MARAETNAGAGCGKFLPVRQVPGLSELAGVTTTAAAPATARSVGPIKAPMTRWTGMKEPIQTGQQLAFAERRQVDVHPARAYKTASTIHGPFKLVHRQPMRVMTMRWRCADISISACLQTAEAWGFGARITRGIRCVEQA